MNFDGISDIYYINSEERPDLMEYTENNLEKNLIKNYTRISDENYSPHKFDEWKHLVDNSDLIDEDIIPEISKSILLIDTINKWIENTDQNTMIIMFDNVDYQYTQYFDFDWEYLMNNIPYDWDSILLGFENLLDVLPCFLHPIRDSYGAGPTLINRRYAKKLVKLHLNKGKFKFHKKISNNFWKNETGYVSYNYFLNQCGRSYAIPMFPKNPDITNDRYFSKENLEMNRKLHLVFWKKLKPKVSVEQFFSYFSRNDLYLNPKVKTTSLTANNINKYN